MLSDDLPSPQPNRHLRCVYKPRFCIGVRDSVSDAMMTFRLPDNSFDALGGKDNDNFFRHTNPPFRHKTNAHNRITIAYLYRVYSISSVILPQPSAYQVQRLLSGPFPDPLAVAAEGALDGLGSVLSLNAIQTRPTGLASVPPAGPAMPVTPRPSVAPVWRRIP